MTRTRRLLLCLSCSILLVPLLPGTAVAATFISGRISTDTTWGPSGSPYVLAEDVTVGPGVSLTIEPGTRVEGSEAAGLVVRGSLIAEGASTEPIIFTSRVGHPDWDGVTIVGAADSDDSSIRHSSFSDATIALKILLASPALSDLELIENEVAIDIMSPSAPVDLTDSVLWGNEVAVTGRANGTISVTGSDFWSNDVNVNAGPRRVYDCTATDGGWEIHGNDILRGPRNSEYWSFDMRTPAGSGDFDYHVDATSNWWGTEDEGDIEARFQAQYTCCPTAERQSIEWTPVAPAPVTRWEPPGEVPDPEAEPIYHADPAFVLAITNVRHGACSSVATFDRLRGYASPALDSAPKAIEVAIRKQGSGGTCGWWKASKPGMVRDGCAYGTWNRLRVDDNYRWSLPLPRSLAVGRYTAFVRVPQRRPQVYGCPAPGRACVRFTLK